MKWFYNMKIGKKLILSFVIVAILAGIVGGVGAYNINKTDKGYSALYTNYGMALGDIAKVSIAYQRNRVNLRDMLLDKGNSDRSLYVSKIKGYDKQIQEGLDAFDKSIQTEEAKREFLKLREAI
ncbi:MCP four helix bundle domain-containing protein [Desulfosporosinus hippei]|uniref:Methyl-accepting chemotaxis protein n=1 Tax=Desulfosporosinus hippei DSM 8344 TaxID=1121419 RepID=A0A1G8IWD8_9FIRM|nr:MCP four helix bundle domain-containing protein [Desulfosporosinus hippei]SDI23007.1 methyl-accepting chemotaxis protein [Desulfosporosinus hippei DSM 8344]